MLMVALLPGLTQARQDPQTPMSTDPVPDATTDQMDPVRDPSAAAVTPADQRFLDDAHASGRKEIHAAALAQDRAKDEDVRELAALIERDHQALNTQLKTAGAHDTDPHPGTGSKAPGTASSGNEAETTAHTTALADDPHMKGLVQAEGSAFDRAYLDMLVKMHRQSIAKFEAVATGQGHSPAVKALAEQALPSLRRHAATAVSLDDTIAEE